jgi:hypothetical protein
LFSGMGETTVLAGFLYESSIEKPKREAIL